MYNKTFLVRCFIYLRYLLNIYKIVIYNYTSVANFISHEG